MGDLILFPEKGDTEALIQVVYSFFIRRLSKEALASIGEDYVKAARLLDFFHFDVEAMNKFILNIL